MLTKLVVTISIIITLVIRFLLVGKKAYKINNLLFIACVIILPIGMFLTVTQSNRLSDYLNRDLETFVYGAVVSSEIVGNEDAYRPKITYEYSVDSVTYTNTTSMNSPMFGNKRKQYDVANVTTKEYPVGKKIKVIYDPSNPSEGNIAIALAWNVYGQIGFGVCLIIISLFGLLLPRKKSWL